MICRVLILSLFLAVIPLSGSAAVDSKKQCRLTRQGECRLYYLPYNPAYTLKDYAFAVFKNMLLKRSGESIDEDLKELAGYVNKKRPGFDMFIEDAKTLAKYTFPQRDANQLFLLATLVFLNNYAAIDFPELNQDQLQRLAHSLYVITYGMYTEEMADFTPFVDRAGFKIGRLGLPENQELSGTIIDFWEDPRAVFIGAFVNSIMNLSMTYFAFSQENARWLMDTVPEMKSKKVVELGAGNGRLASILRANGVKVVATDLEPTFNNYIDNSVIAMDAVTAVQRYRSEDVIFLITVPGWELADTLKQLKKNRRWTLVILSEYDSDDFEELSSPELGVSIRQIKPPSSFRLTHSLQNISPTLSIYTNIADSRQMDSHREL